MHSRLYRGRVWHHRSSPRAHAFRQRLFLLYLDLDELPGLFDGLWLWSARRPAVAWFRRADHLGDPALPLARAVRERVARETGTLPEGPVRLLTHLRYLGYCMNPVSFYYCFDAGDEALEFIVAEVHNTPWGERHCYVLDCRAAPLAGGWHRFALDKAFHVSPFMPMTQRYAWAFSLPRDRLDVRMTSLESGERRFEAGLALRGEPIAPRALARALFRFPFMTGQVIGAIYWQALRLWLKGAPFHPHPKHGEKRGCEPARLARRELE